MTQSDNDVKFQFYHGKDKVFHFWFNTRMLIPGPNGSCPKMPLVSDRDMKVLSDPEDTDFRLYLEKTHLDKAVKDKDDEIFPSSFAVEMIFQSVFLEYLKLLQKK